MKCSYGAESLFRMILNMTFFRKYKTSGHFRHGVKVGLASVLAYVISGVLGFPYAYWAVITTVIVMQMHVADSIHMCLYRFTGTAIGAVVGMLAILVFPPTPLYTLLGIFIGTGVCAYLTRFNERFRMAAITLAIVFLTSLGDEHRIQFTLLRVAEIGVGVLCAFVVSVAVFPRRVGATLRSRLVEQYKELTLHYSEILGNFLSYQQRVAPDLFDEMVGEVQRNKEMFHKVYAMERRFFRDDVRLLSLQVSVLRSVMERLQAMLPLLNEVEGVGFDIILAPELNELLRTTNEALMAIATGTPHDGSELEKAIIAIETRFVEIRRLGVTNRFGARRLFQVLGFINSAQHLGEYVLLKLKEMNGL